MDSRLFVLTCFLMLVHQSFQKDTVKISLFYESYCPYSIKFVEEQLAPAWKKFGNALHLDLLPYGKANQTHSHGHWHFTCQHGEKECIGNILHACSIYELVTSSPHKEITKMVNLIKCVMNEEDQEKSAKQCCKKYQINYMPIKKCEKSKQGERLLAKYGSRTHSFTPQIKWVPTIVFNDVYNQDDDDKAETDLDSVICKYIPNNSHCKNKIL